jgi:DNA invertase Pin-like site-specific DNA recombinase
VSPDLLLLLAILYLRQSTLRQVLENTGSTDVQRDQRVHALRLGWPETNILVIDEDLGLSGTSAEGRSGFQRMKDLVRGGQVGAIFTSDFSRLSRSYLVFAELADLCQTHGVLLVVDGRIVDFDDPGDEFMAYIHAGIARLDNKLRTKRFQQAAKAKARRGHAVRPPPSGYEAVAGGQWVKDREQAVRDAVARVFEDFLRFGNVHRLVRHYHDHGIRLPIRKGGEVRWVPAYAQRIHSWLTNPAYKGEYVFGRWHRVNGKDRRQLDPNEIVRVPNHHEAYVSPEVWDRIQGMLEQRRVSAERQPPGEGPGLCQGVIRCGQCQRKMTKQQYETKRGKGYAYVCSVGTRFGEPLCQRVAGSSVDRRLEPELFALLGPSALEDALAATTDANAGYEAARQQREAELRRAEERVAIARRRYELENPERRSLMIALGRDYDQALEHLQALRVRHAAHPLIRPLVPTPETVAAIRQLTEDLPALWAAPTTSHQDRKDLFRLFVREVVLEEVDPVRFTLTMHWVGGAVTRHSGFRPLGPHQLARQLAAEGRTHEQIAQELSRGGALNPRTGQPYRGADIEKMLRLRELNQRRKQDAWKRRREGLREQLTELVTAGWGDTAIAVEFNRRGLPTFRLGGRWSYFTVKLLRQKFALPLGRTYYQQHDPFREPICRLLEAGKSDAAIAEELNRLTIHNYQTRIVWTAKKVLSKRLQLRLLRRDRSPHGPPRDAGEPRGPEDGCLERKEGSGNSGTERTGLDRES